MSYFFGIVTYNFILKNYNFIVFKHHIIFMDKKQSFPTIKDFVLQEAHEKAFERLVLGLKEYQKEKSKIISEKRDVLHGQFQKKHKDQNAQRRIQKSSKINESRMKKMNARHENLTSMVIKTEIQLSQRICKNQSKYSKLLKGLIIQGLIKLLEPIVYVRCLSRDKELISKIIPECKRQFQQLIKREGIPDEIGEIDLQVDNRYSLTERNPESSDRVEKNDENNTCFGGVIMTSQDGLIVCKNTLDSRLELAYQHMLPIIRTTLYD